jgi:hypothetical protein
MALERPPGLTRSCLRGARGKPLPHASRRFRAKADVTTFEVFEPMEEYWVEPQQAIGQDNSNLHLPTPQETRKSAKKLIWRAKRLAADLRARKVSGWDSENIPYIALAQQKAARHWILDSDPCFDIVGRRTLSAKDEARIKTTDKHVTLQTANGVVRENRRVELPVGKIKMNVDALVFMVPMSARRIPFWLGCRNAPGANRPGWRRDHVGVGVALPSPTNHLHLRLIRNPGKRGGGREEG